MTGNPIVRVLTGDDAAAYKVIRLRALQDHPEAFASTYEDEKDQPLTLLVDRFNQPTTERFMLGAFVDNDLVGTVGGYRDSLRKCQHRAHIGAMYTAPEVRGKGVGRRLLTEAIRRLSALDGIEDITLAVTAGNESAEALYRNVGFVLSYTDIHFFKIDGVYFDVDWMILHLESHLNG